MHGRGFEIHNDGTITNEGIWENAAFVKEEKVNLKDEPLVNMHYFTISGFLFKL
jgi:hypothetical protein